MLSVTNFSLENNLPTFRLNAPVIGLMMTGAFSQNVGRLFSKLNLVTDNLREGVITNGLQSCSKELSCS